jgi:SPP1 gp7 family putative phage head morphogenesis protein
VNAVSSRLAAHGGMAAVELAVRADRMAAAADGAVLKVWRDILKLIQKRDLHAWNSWEEAVKVCGRLLPAVKSELASQLKRAAVWSHQQTARTLRKTLPVGVMNAAVRMHRQNVYRIGGMRQSMESIRMVEKRREIAEDFRWEDLLSPLRGTGESPANRDYFASLLFPSPSDTELDRILYATGWEERFNAGTRLAAPQQLASIVVSGMAMGKNPREIAQDLRPVVQGVQASAMRIARTFGHQVANAGAMQCHEALGDLVAGYQVIALLDQNTRPAHAARNGTIYWARPKPGQPGYDVMPRPPLEADGSVAWGCRCHLQPVLTDPGTIIGMPTEPVFTDNEKVLSPDPVTFSEWWRDADEKRRRLAVGTRRYSLLQDRLGRDPDWEHFLSETGDLLQLASLKAETEQERHGRLAKVYAMMTRRHIDKRMVATYGFVPGV